MHGGHVAATRGVPGDRHGLDADVLLVLFIGQVHAREGERDLLVKLPAQRGTEVAVVFRGRGRSAGHVATSQVLATPVVVEACAERTVLVVRRDGVRVLRVVRQRAAR